MTEPYQPPSRITGERPNPTALNSAFDELVSDGFAEGEATELTAVAETVGMEPTGFSRELIRLRGAARDMHIRRGDP